MLASSPLRHATFRNFYIASVGVALGYTMQATMAAWLMAVMTPSEVMVALVQTMSTAPAILFGLVAGALSDIIERRHIILATQVVFLLGTVLLGIATLLDVMAPCADSKSSNPPSADPAETAAGMAAPNAGVCEESGTSIG